VAKAWIWVDPPPASSATGAWVPATFAIAPDRFVRTEVVVAYKMDRDFYVIDRDGHQQTGRKGDYLVVEDGFERVVEGRNFEPSHYRVPDIGDLGDAAVARRAFAAAVESVLQQRELPLSDPAYEELALQAADAIVAILATMK
jgi:hypothetical protein